MADGNRRRTSGETPIALLIAGRRTNADVAAELGLAEKTVEWHLARAARKLHVRSRADLAVVIAERQFATVQRKRKGD